MDALVVEAPPVKKARRVVKAQEKPLVTNEAAEGLSNAPSATNVAARATRTTARTQKTVSKREEAPEAGPSVPKRRGRPPKVCRMRTSCKVLYVTSMADTTYCGGTDSCSRRTGAISAATVPSTREGSTSDTEETREA